MDTSVLLWLMYVCVMLIVLLAVFVYGELAFYQRGGDVWEWTKTLHKWLREHGVKHHFK